LVPSAAVACLWDYDTIKMERTRFPGTLELITGKFLRHSPEFYRWRIQNRLKRLESDPTNAALLDDLAVAYDKTGQHDKAIETALKTEQLHPGRYETAANLGTFYIHAGRPADGLPHIDRALKINPDAHFGREKYQKLLVEYVLHRRQGGPLRLPLAEVTVHPETILESPSAHNATISNTFDAFLRRDRHEPLTPNEASAAVKGILGMMKFGKHDSPVLLEALGTLLVQNGHNPTTDAKLLAARAFLKASYEVPDGPARVAYRAMAGRAIQMQTPRRDQIGQISLEQVEADLQRELDDAQAWYADLRGHELSWICDGRDPEAEFDKLYLADPELPGMDVTDPISADEKLGRYMIAGVIIFVVAAIATLAGAILILRRLWVRRSASIAHRGFVAEAEPGAAADGGGT
jgi:tetratricopeptide (TPR) repeat protein